MKHSFTLPLVLLLLATVGCHNQGHEAATRPASQVDADVAAIKALVEQWTSLYNARDFDGLMSAFYAEDCVLVSPHAVHKGKAAILLSFRRDDEVNAEHVDSSLVEDVRVSGDLAVARGADTGVTTPRGGGRPDKYSLKWLMAFARQPDGTWKCIDEMWNDS